MRRLLLRKLAYIAASDGMFNLLQPLLQRSLTTEENLNCGQTAEKRAKTSVCGDERAAMPAPVRALHN
jgi:hypothetical protein